VFLSHFLAERQPTCSHEKKHAYFACFRCARGITPNRSVVAKSLRYLTNNQDKMKYAEYRKQGLPIVSSLVESMMKQISRRVKGTEKFWSDDGAEAVIQLRADYLSDGDLMTNYWKRRQAAADGQRHYRYAHSCI